MQAGIWEQFATCLQVDAKQPNFPNLKEVCGNDPQGRAEEWC